MKSIGTLPAATLEQRLASMSEVQLMDAARALVSESRDLLATRVLEALEARCPGQAFDAFVEELYA